MSNFSKNKFAVVNDTLSNSRLQELLEYYEEHKANDSLLSLERNNHNALGVYGDKKGEQLLLELLPTIQDIVGVEVYPTYSYVRCYLEGAKLQRHVDRNSNEFTATISICRDSNLLDWPLELIDPNGQVRSFSLAIGDMLILKGQELLHWRKPLKGKYWMQIFLGYVSKKGKHSDFKFDKRSALGLGLIKNKNIILDSHESDYLNIAQILCTRFALKNILQSEVSNSNDLDVFLKGYQSDYFNPVTLKATLKYLGYYFEIKLLNRIEFDKVKLPILVHIPNQKVFFMVTDITDTDVYFHNHENDLVHRSKDAFFAIWKGVVLQKVSSKLKVNTNELLESSRVNLDNYKKSIEVSNEFLTEEECNQLNDYGSSYKVIIDKPLFPIKIKNQFLLPSELDIVKNIREKISNFIGIKESQIELLEYNEFNQDDFEESHFEHENKTESSLRRIKAGLILLNKASLGGQINFPEIDFQPNLSPGDLLVYDLISRNNTQETKSLIELLTIKKGTMSCIKFWIREN